MKLDKWLPEKYQKEFNIETESSVYFELDRTKIIKRKPIKKTLFQRFIRLYSNLVQAFMEF